MSQWRRTLADRQQATLDHCFPGALDSNQAFDAIVSALVKEEFTPQNTLFASSVCVDEICHDKGDLNERLGEYWGECFYLGGLGGISAFIF